MVGVLLFRCCCSLSELGPVRKEPERRGEINSPHQWILGAHLLSKHGGVPSPAPTLNSSAALVRPASQGLSQVQWERHSPRSRNLAGETEFPQMRTAESCSTSLSLSRFRHLDVKGPVAGRLWRVLMAGGLEGDPRAGKAVRGCGEEQEQRPGLTRSPAAGSVVRVTHEGTKGLVSPLPVESDGLSFRGERSQRG